MLGAYKDRLPVYASTHHGQDDPGGLDSPEAFGEYAAACADRGFAGFKIHGWHDGNVRREAATLRAVRRAVGDRIHVMYDPGCQIRTHLEALRLGHVCDEIDALWYEDPYRDSGVSMTGSQIIRQKIRTPLMVTEHARGPERKAAYAIAGACDLFHIDLWGPMAHGYFCDLTRSTVIGAEPTDSQRRVLEDSIELVEQVIARIEPGVPLSALRAVGVEMMDRRGGGSSAFSAMIPFVGHSLGLECERFFECRNLLEFDSKYEIMAK
jgi:hypothetical protein